MGAAHIQIIIDKGSDNLYPSDLGGVTHPYFS